MLKAILLTTLLLSVSAITVCNAQTSTNPVSMQELKKDADSGNAEAQNNLGTMYFNGEGVKQDYAEALKWFQKAAGQGIPNAQFNVGVMYYKGLGVKQDTQKALEWLQKAADQGDEGAKKTIESIKKQPAGNS